MSLSSVIEYEDGNNRLRYVGIRINNPDFDNYLKTRVNNRFYDAEGSMNLLHTFDDVRQTGFDPSHLSTFFSSTVIPKSWKIGEKLTECFLEDQKNVLFPYNDSRDEKDKNSNLPGSDLVGLVTVDNEILFLFGEVKTSAEIKNPPSVVTSGDDSLENQLEELKTQKIKRQELILWLGHKITPLIDSDINKTSYKTATLNYVVSKCNKFKIFGVMIRDVTPNKKDLEFLYTHVITNLHVETHIELLSIYIPTPISKLVSVMGVKNHEI